MHTPISLADLTWHEECEPIRLQRTLSALRAEPVFEPVHLSEKDLVILDGAHRCKASQMLGRGYVPAHLVPIGQAALLPGWTHILPPGVTIEDLSDNAHGAIIATVQQGRERRSILAPPDDLHAFWNAYWSIAHQYETTPYERATSANTTATCVTWHPPRWGLIVDLIRHCGPLPPGITRLGAIINQNCLACGSRRPQRSER